MKDIMQDVLLSVIILAACMLPLILWRVNELLFAKAMYWQQMYRSEYFNVQYNLQEHPLLIREEKE